MPRKCFLEKQIHSYLMLDRVQSFVVLQELSVSGILGQVALQLDRVQDLLTDLLEPGLTDGNFSDRPPRVASSVPGRNSIMMMLEQ